MEGLYFIDLLEDYIDGCMILDESDQIIFADKKMKSLSTREVVYGHSISSVINIDIESLKRKGVILHNIQDKIYEIKLKQYRSAGKVYQVIIINSLVDFDNSDVRLYCLEEIINNIYEGVIVSDYNGKLVLYNKSQEDLEGLKAKSVIRKYIWDAYGYNNPELSEHRKVFNSGKPIVNAYKAHAFANGEAKYLSYSTYPIYKNDKIIAVYTVSQNETSLRNLLHETIDLKRQLFSNDSSQDEKPVNRNGTKYTFDDIKSESRKMKDLIREAQNIALMQNNVLIVGETGTGKELFAQSIHNFGQNQKEPFIAINCAAIPENLLESTLFGTVKGAYTGAVDRIGLFEAARKGTLFLDEVNSLTVTLQTKLLRAVEEKLIRKIGGLSTIPVTCRLICATNRNPAELIENNILREDFYYRIAGATIQIPPLRERDKDIIYLSNYFIHKHNRLLGKKIESMSNELQKALLKYQWQGNIRELEHTIQSVMIKADGKQLSVEHLPDCFLNSIVEQGDLNSGNDESQSLPRVLNAVEARILRKSLLKNNWNLTRTSKELGIIRQSLNYRMKKLNITKPE